MVWSLDFLLVLGQSWGYLGAFAIGVLSSFTLFIPSPAFMAVLLLAPFMNPILLGIAAGFGSAVGEITGYGAGFVIEKLAEKKRKALKKQLAMVERWFQRHHPDLVIFVFSVTPLMPIDALGIFCGAIRYPVKRFFIMVLIGKLIKYIALALIGFYALSWILSWLPFEL
jgi:membrane protein YqaA with SNARE-associated domain